MGTAHGVRRVAHAERLADVRGVGRRADRDSARDRAVSVRSARHRRSGDGMSPRVRAFVALVLIVAAGALARAARAVTHRPTADLDALPLAIGAWSGRDAGALDEESERILAADAYLNRSYLSPQSGVPLRSEEHTSELQSHVNLVCRLLLEKKKQKRTQQRQE